MLNLLISQRVYVDSHGELADALEAANTRYYNSLGINLYPVSNFVKDVERYLAGVNYSGLILSGGGDVSPKYCSTGNSTRFKYSSDRDAVESLLVDMMISEGLPVLGVCHGMQFLNCRFGGSITADIHKNESVRAPRSDHYIRIVEKRFGLEGAYKVNQYHDNGISASQVASCFDVFAVDADFDVVEGIIHKTLPICAIQWHPERVSPQAEINASLIRSFFRIQNGE